MRRPITGVARAAGALVLLVTVLVIAPRPAQAAGTLTPWSSSVAVGATFSVTANGCPTIEDETDTGFTYQQPELVVVTTTSAGERMAAFGQQVDDTRWRFRIPGWVDPADPAVVAGRCVRTTYVFDDEPGEQVTTEVLFTYADAAIDITPGTAVPPGPFVSLDRNTAAGGQVITATVTGCDGADFVEVALLAGGDLSFRAMDEFVIGTGAQAIGGGATLELVLNTRGEFDPEDGGISGGGPLPEGDYALLAACGFEEEGGGYIAGEPQLITVSGTNPSGAWAVEVDDSEVHAMGSQCPAGTTVTVRLRGFSYNEEWLVEEQADRRALIRRDIGLGRLTPDDDGEFDETFTTTAGDDGTWAVSSPAPEGSFDLIATADCGDPTATGFRYLERYVYGNGFADLYIDRTSPTASPTGGTVAISIGGYCEGPVTVALATSDREILSESAPFSLNEYGLGSGTVTAPDSPGEYRAVGSCDGQLSYPDPYTVFASDPVAAAQPLPDEPTEGWPSRGARQIYNGKIGPISLPAMDMGQEEMAGAKALGPSALFIDVPRPDGDFAITEITFGLVDAEGMPVGQDQAHLHHFVVANRSGENPACPDGTFGLPGQIVAASGAERTVLSMGDPYGLVVEDSDQWTGVYELMTRSMEDQTVFLTYDITYRTDVENVRPVTPYFGSASGCSSFTWTIDGSGTPDTQSTFITIEKDARLIGTGAHIHNGAMHADMTNDRGRRLCRSEIDYGDEAVGHHDMLGSLPGRQEPARAEATTTMVEGPDTPTQDDWPPEFYDDDLEIEGISTCPLAESVSAGERLRFDAVYENDRARSGAMGIYTFYVWEGGGPAEAGPPPAQGIPGNPDYTG